AQKVFRFARFFLARPTTKTKFLLGNCIVRLTIVRSDASPTPDKLLNQSPGHWSARNNIREIDHRFSKLRRAFVQIIYRLLGRHSVLPDHARFAILTPERLFYFVIRHLSFPGPRPFRPPHSR